MHMSFFLGLAIGGVIGVFFMCMLRIADES
ncbi:MAG: DUF3789 domain-containing protein [Clostridia bacterium]|nr:DUF3789 domain-containing protein [Clostridia bacterium]